MTSTSTAGRPATVEDLYRVDGKAELVGGRLVRDAPTGFTPNRASIKIVASLLAYERERGTGFAIADNCAFIVDLPHRRSFSPDAAYFVGPSTGMKFLRGAPVFAVEVRSEGDYGPAAERRHAVKRADYFAAGTLAVWDVDPIGEDVVRVFRPDHPEAPTTYRRGDVADAEPAVPGWRLAVDEIVAFP